ncbi:unnamed protein product [Effrenium voratum]|uniref:Uncharacterized protein n=1 Tax=Effrenium voratum TaxID=2562239 RepID=A0AA36JBB6_9DINO|nr:unnamed protein product [Effrenium voratum]CAJ1433091.1 unnamed protein product [Effrenium voratum]
MNAATPASLVRLAELHFSRFRWFGSFVLPFLNESLAKNPFVSPSEHWEETGLTYTICPLDQLRKDIAGMSPKDGLASRQALWNGVAHFQTCADPFFKQSFTAEY